VSLGARKPPPEALPSLRGSWAVYKALPSAVGAVSLRLRVGQDDGCGGGFLTGSVTHILRALPEG